MTSLNEHDQQLLQTLLNHADAVAPPTEKPAQSAHSRSLDFSSSEHDLHFWENFINSGEEAMQFEQQSSSSAFQGSHSSTPSVSSFQSQASSDFSGQQIGINGVVSQASSNFNSQQAVFSGVQTSLAGFSDRGHSYQQVQPSPVPASSQMAVGSSDTYPNQSSNYQTQQFSVQVSAMDQDGGQLEKPRSSLACGFSTGQSQGFPQQYSMDTTCSEAQSDAMGGSYQAQCSSYQPQTPTQFSDSSRHLQAHQQQVGQTGGTYLSSLPNTSKEQVGHSSSAYSKKDSDNQQQTFLSEFRGNGNPDCPLAVLVQAAVFQQQYSNSGQSQPVQERRDSSQQQQSMENFASQLASYQQLQQASGQQQTLYQQGAQAQVNSSSSSDQIFHSNTAEGTSLCFGDELSAFSPNTGQQEQPRAMTASTTVENPASLQANGVGEEIQHMQYQNSSSSQTPASQENAEAYQGQVPHYTKNSSFHSPCGSPAQPVASPPSYPQPSPDPHGTYSKSVPPMPSQGEKMMGLGYTGKSRGFSKQQSFNNPVASPDSPALDGSMPNSPAGNFQHHSPAPFSIKSPYSAPPQLPSQGDQDSRSNYNPHTPVFSQPLPSPGDQNSFNAGTVYSSSGAKEVPQSVAGGFQTQDNMHSHCNIQNDSGVPVQSNSFQPSPFQSASLPSVQGNATAQPMHEGSGPSSIEAEAVAFLVQESLQSLDQTQVMDSNNSAVSYQQMPLSQSAMNSQRDQPMETQQSPCVVGTSSNTDSFQSPPPVIQPGIYQETVPQGGQVSQGGDSYLNQGLPLMAQPRSYQAPSSSSMQPSVFSSQSLAPSMAGLVSGSVLQSAPTAFASNSLASSFPCSSSAGSETVANATDSFSDLSSARFINQADIASRQTASALNTQTTSSGVGEQGVMSVTENAQFTIHAISSSSFNLYGSDTSSFGRNTIQLQVQQQQMQQQVPQQPQLHQQFPQIVSQQQTVQPAVFSSPAGGLSLIHNNNAHSLSSVVNESIQIASFQAAAGSSSSSHSVTVLGNQPFPLEAAQNTLLTEQSGSMHTVAVPLQSSSVPNQLPFAAQATPLSQPVLCPVGQSSTLEGKSHAVSSQDSSQTTNALALLSSVLMQIQSILPKANDLQKESSGTPGMGENPEVVTQLLQSQNSATQILQLLQQQQQPAEAAAQTLKSGSQHTPPSQAFAFNQQQKQPVVNEPMVQQPNFLVQPGSSPHVVLATPLQQHQQAGHLQLPSKHTVVTPGQQIVAEIPASMVASLAGSLGSQGISISSNGQLMIGNQSVKLLLDSSSVPTSVNLVLGQTTSGLSSATAALPSMTPSLVDVRALPADLQNVPVNLLPQVATTTSAGSLTRTISTTPTTSPNLGSSISKNTSVVPTSSFTQPLSVAGVGMGLTVPSSSTTNPADTNGVFPVPLSSKPQPAAPVTSVDSGVSSVGSPSIANIFYPINSACRVEKRRDSSASLTPVPVGNFLNVTTGSASMLLNAFSMAVADGKQDSTGFKVGGFPVVEASTSHENNERRSADMEIVEVGERTSSPVKPMETSKPVTKLASRHSRKTSLEEDLEVREEGTPGSVLRRILTMKDEDGNAASSKADTPTTPGNSPVATPTELLDGNTQATLIEKSENLRLNSEAQQDDDVHSDFWTSVPSFVSVTTEEYVPSKVHRGADDVDASSKHVSVPSVEKLFDAGGATSNSAFVFTKFGAEESGVRTFGRATPDPGSAISSPVVTEERMSGVVSSMKPELLKLGHVPTASVRISSRRQKDPALTYQFPSKVGEYELKILAQPEEQHRARYLTEGSRGAVKDKSQQGYPHIKLIGYNEPATLQVFIGSESGRVKPHGFYQACKVCGKNSTPCTEREIDGTNVIESEISPLNDMQVYMDCVGILKLRNADVEKRIGPTKAKAKKKNSTKARLVFRCSLRKPDGGFVTLQVASTPILCTQPIGQPEISRLSITEMCVNQTNDLFIIGKNFLKGTKIVFQEVCTDEQELSWQSEAEIEVEFFQQTHLICRVPEYPNKKIKQPVPCRIVALCAGKVSDPQDFTYKPAMVMVKVENDMETEPSVAATRAMPFSVSPVALQLNRLVERTHPHPSSSSSPTIFQLPLGTIPAICMQPPTLPTPSRLVASSVSQPLSSALKPARLCLPDSGQTLTLGPSPASTTVANPAPNAADSKNPVPMQFVLPSPGAVSVDSRQLGSQPTQLVLMSAPPPPSSPLTISLSGKAPPPPVLTFTTMASTASSSPSPSSSSNQTRTTSAPMILFLTGQPATVSTSSSMAVTHSTAAMPISLHQTISNGQVDSLLKQLLESSNPSS